MTRHFVLGNGTILVGLDRNAYLRDFYFPYVGQENHVNGKEHRLGVWIEGQFSWLADPAWEKTVAYKKDTLVTNFTATNVGVGVQVITNDAVLHTHNIFLRKVTLINTLDKKREARLFFHQNFEISEANIGDTVYYDPILNSVIHYKGRRNFLMNGCFYDGKQQGISSYTTGLVGEYGMVSTYIDAEDGVLSQNPIEHGSVDSTISFNFSLPPLGRKEVYYWICVGEKYHEVHDLNDYVLQKKPSFLLQATEKYWHHWVNKRTSNFPGLSSRSADLFKRSLLIINTHVDKRGAIIASSDSDILFLRRDTYNYMWPRDGALIARSLDRAGYSEVTEHFFKFCSRIVTDEGFLFHKYRPDGSLGSSWHPWVKHGHIQLPIQEDQIALVLDALWKHYLQHGKKKSLHKVFSSFIQKSANFLYNFIDSKTGLPKESYDLWEEKLGIHTFTCATVYSGLIAAANFEKVFGRSSQARKFNVQAAKVKKGIIQHLYDGEKFIKGIYYDGTTLRKDFTLDLSSIYGIFEYKVLDSADLRVVKNIELIQNRLHCNTSSGGYARYYDDYYYRVDTNTPGNPWFITTLWMAEYYINKAKTVEELKPAIEIFEWVANHALETGILPEQLDPHTAEPISVSPLTWSHAGYVIAINKYLEKLEELNAGKQRKKR